MCGIAGFVGPGCRDDLAAMTRSLAHRGPDAEGLYGDTAAAVFLGHRRLSIIDLEGGAQPMWTADGRFGVVFNGEIYNHVALREELRARGCQFQTDHSDTEVLLHAYREWGEGFVSRLNGMWAFAIYDRTARTLFLSRDRFGKKPLYYFCEGGVFAFASELTALLKHPRSPREICQRSVAKFFAYACIPAPNSIVRGISKLPAGHNLTVDIGDPRPRVERYWEYLLEPMAPPRDAERVWGEELRAILEASVRRRLMADVPLGIFLSGGIDSSAIAALAARHVPAGALKTFSVGFTEASFDERAHAEKIAAQIGSEHRSEVLDLDAALELIPGLLSSLDEPIGDSSILPTWLLARFTRRHVTVALGGDGGDELFAGYDPFRALRLADAYARLVPKAIHPAIRLLASSLPVSHGNISLDFKIKRTLRGLSYPPALWNPVWLGALEPTEIEAATGIRIEPEDLYSEAIAAWESAPGGSPVDRTTQFFTRIYLQDGILAKVDRATMLNSLETRSPFLDIEMADFARRIPWTYKLRGGETKYLLKRALEPILPRDILYRKKKGFGTPVGPWFRSGRLAPDVAGPFVGGKLRDHRSGASDERLFLWCELALQRWKAARS